MADRVGVSVTKRICSIDDCGKPCFGHGWCQAHYTRWRKHGDPLASVAVAVKGAPSRVGCEVDGCPGRHKAKGLCGAHYAQTYRQENADTVREAGAAYRAANREAIAERARAWHQANADRTRRQKAEWYEANRGLAKKRRQAYVAANRDAVRVANSRRRAVERGSAVNDLTGAEWSAIKAAYGHRCVYCHTKPKRLTQDHVIPLSKGGHHTASNVVPACRSCNSRKGTREAPIFQPILL